MEYEVIRGEAAVPPAIKSWGVGRHPGWPLAMIEALIAAEGDWVAMDLKDRTGKIQTANSTLRNAAKRRGLRANIRLNGTVIHARLVK